MQLVTSVAVNLPKWCLLSFLRPGDLAAMRKVEKAILQELAGKESDSDTANKSVRPRKRKREEKQKDKENTEGEPKTGKKNGKPLKELQVIQVG